MAKLRGGKRREDGRVHDLPESNKLAEGSGGQDVLRDEDRAWRRPPSNETRGTGHFTLCPYPKGQWADDTFADGTMNENGIGKGQREREEMRS